MLVVRLMRPMIGLMRSMLNLHPGWLLWLAALMAVNAVAPLFFLPAPEAVVTLALVGAGILIMTVIFARWGFVRLLGLAHFPWFLLIPWIWSRLGVAPAGSPQRLWMLALIAMNGVSLLIDVADVVRWVNGERGPMAPGTGSAARSPS